MYGKRNRQKKSLLIVIVVIFSSIFSSIFSYSSTLDSSNFMEKELKNKAIQTDVKKRLSSHDSAVQLPDFESLENPPSEPICFIINHINANSFFSEWVEKMGNKYLEKCVGQQGIRLYLRAINQRLLSLGYITSRAVLPEQDLSKGILNIFVQEGRIEEIIFPSNFDRYMWTSAFPMTKGDLINMRDLEQAVDQLNRLSSVTVKMSIEPGRGEGFSNIKMAVEEIKAWEIDISLDDAGGESTGKNQLTVGATIDNFIGVLDTLSYSKTLDLNDNKESDSLSDSFSLNIPVGYWSIDFANSNFFYHQKVIGSVQSFKNSGKGHDSSIKVTQVFFRDNSYKLSWFTGLFKRQRRNYIDDTEVEIQSRDLTNALLGFGFRKYIGSSVLDFNIELEKGVDLFSAEELDKNASSDEAQPDYERFGFSGLFSTPFLFIDKQYNLTSQLSFQYSPTPIYSLDWMSNGGRYSVRGFASNDGLSAERGWLMKHDISTQLAIFDASITPYVGIDVGGVSGEGAEGIDEKTLIGVTFGLKGNLLKAKYDAFISQPILLSGPYTDTDCCQIGASLSWQI